MLINIILLGIILTNIFMLITLINQSKSISSLSGELDILRKVVLDMRKKYSVQKPTIH